MSMRSNFIYGYGFNCECDDEKIFNFIKAHEETFCEAEFETELFRMMLENPECSLEDLFDHYECEISGNEGIDAVISNIMTRETKIGFAYCPPDHDCGRDYVAVVFETTYPYLITEDEKDLTEMELKEICNKYMGELGIPEGSSGYLELEYWG